MLSVLILNFAMQSIINLSFTMKSVIILSLTVRSVMRQSVILPNVAAPIEELKSVQLLFVYFDRLATSSLFPSSRVTIVSNASKVENSASKRDDAIVSVANVAATTFCLKTFRQVLTNPRSLG